MPSSKRQTYSTSPIHATRPLMNDQRTIGKQRIHRRVENTVKQEANATARHKTTGKTPKHPTTNQHPGVSYTSLSRLQSIL